MGPLEISVLGKSAAGRVIIASRNAIGFTVRILSYVRYLGSRMCKVFVPFLLLPSLLFGWGKTGHRVVGQIAENHLSPKAAKAVRELLGVEPLAMVGTWADEIRSDPAWKKAEPWHYVNIPDGETY